MNKIISVSKDTHKILKIGASNAELTIKRFVEKLAVLNENGIPFDVDKHSTDDLISVYEDIENKLRGITDNLTESQKEFIGYLNEK